MNPKEVVLKIKELDDEGLKYKKITNKLVINFNCEKNQIEESYSEIIKKTGLTIAIGVFFILIGILILAIGIVLKSIHIIFGISALILGIAKIREVYKTKELILDILESNID